MIRNDINEIEILINNYFEGIFLGNVIQLESCFYEHAYIYGDIKSIYYSKSLKKYIDTVKNRQSPNDLDEDFNMKVIDIDILGKIGMVKLHVPMLGYNYYDYLSLFKINSNWKIVNKIFTHLE